MRTLFDIGDKNVKADLTLCEWGSHYCCLAGFDTTTNSMQWIQYKTFESLSNETVHSIVNELDGSNRIVLSSVFSEFLLTPHIYNEQQTILDLLPAKNKEALQTDSINEWQINIQFAPNQFSVLVKKRGQLQLAQIYKYQSPLDVVYYLLKIIEELDLSRDETVLILSGLIEEKSDLYKELYQYFLHIQFSSPASNNNENNDLPTYFFTSLYNLSACVS